MTILLKHSLSKAHNTASVLALIVAARGALYNKANSPKDSPGTYVFKYVGVSPDLKTFSQVSSPESTKYNTSPYDKLLLDLMYISKPNLADDIRIMFATLKTVFIKESTDGMDDTTLNTGDISDINAFFSKETELEEDD